MNIKHGLKLFNLHNNFQQSNVSNVNNENNSGDKHNIYVDLINTEFVMTQNLRRVEPSFSAKTVIIIHHYNSKGRSNCKK